MINCSNLSYMTILGWRKQYFGILKEFGYSEKQDFESALLLDSIIKKPISLKVVDVILSGKSVFVIGSGPSISLAIPVLKKFPDVPKIAADSVIDFLLKNKIIPDIVVTDLDANEKSLKKISNNAIMIVHAHGDNIAKLRLAFNFRKCLGTTQTKELGNLNNFGGFTDGDRCVFFANNFNPKNIILFGMDFGIKIGVHSKTKKSERTIKLKKLKRGKKLLKWLATKTKCDLYTTSNSIIGFKKICFTDLKDIIIT